jgi:hypothetical protein
LPLHNLDIRLKPHIPSPYPATSPLFSSPYPPPAVLHYRASNEGLGVITQRMGMYIGTRTPHVSLTNTEQIFGSKKKNDFPVLA